MPLRSDAQRKYLFAKEPTVAKKFAAETPKGKKLPERLHPAAKQAFDSFADLHGMRPAKKAK